MYNLSACVFIRNNISGAFMLFESLASLLPFVDEFVVMDLGSTDGTLEILRDLTNHNQKLKLIIEPDFPLNEAGEYDANVFAVLANELIAWCRYENVLYYQADEIWHQDLLKQMDLRFQQGKFDLSFWRVQFRENFQRLKWFPHIVHRVGHKDSFNFVGDGMNSDRYMDAEFCYDQFNAGWFTRWGAEFDFLGNAKNGQVDTPAKMPIHEMITDVSLVGGFIDNIAERRNMHAPFWHEEPTIENKPASEWMRVESQNPNWTKTSSPFDLPQIMRGLVGKKRYEVRPELLEAIRQDQTRGLIGYD